MKFLFTFFLMGAAVVANAQIYKVQKMWAFVTESMPGARPMTDENGKEIKPASIIVRFIFIETNYKAEPKIESVLYDGKQYRSTINAVTGKKYQAGSIYSNGKPFFITPKKGNKLWRIVVIADAEMPASNEVKLITIKGKLGNSNFKQTLYNETRLAGPEYQ